MKFFIIMVVLQAHLSFGILMTGSSTAAERGTIERTKRAGVQSVTDEQLATISETLFDLDNDNAAKFVKVNPQAHVNRDTTIDAAPKPLLTVNHIVYKNSTYSTMRALLNNYNSDVYATENVTKAELLEEKNFLNAILKTKVMKKLQDFLIQKDIMTSADNFREELQRLLFGLYSRSSRISTVGSCGFEHIFIGENDGNKSSGFHSWITLNLLEESGYINYIGYKSWSSLPGNTGEIIHASFVSNKRVKSSSMFIGTSPELDIAYYILCFLICPGSPCKVYPKGKMVIIRAWSLDYNGKNYIGSAYPEA